MLNRRSFLRGAAAASVAAPVVALFGACTAKSDREAFVPLPHGGRLLVETAPTEARLWTATIYSKRPDWSFTLDGKTAEKVDAVDVGGGFFRVTATA